jgi:hypothetical protein
LEADSRFETPSTSFGARSEFRERVSFVSHMAVLSVRRALLAGGSVMIEVGTRMRDRVGCGRGKRKN